MTRLLHISDLHFGRLTRPLALEPLIEAIAELAPDAFVVSGDLVEWGECPWMWRPAAAFLSRLEAPLAVVPGNHDVPRLHLVQRALDLWHGFDRFVRPAADTVVEVPGATIVCLATPRRWTPDLGQVDRGQLRFARQSFEAAPADHLRAVAMHHGLAQISRGPLRDCVHGARYATWAFADMGADLVMTGHNHFPHLAQLGPGDGRQFLWSQAGTAGAGRRRPWREQRRSFSLVEADAEWLRVQWWFYESASGRFVPEESHPYRRRPSSP